MKSVPALSSFAETFRELNFLHANRPKGGTAMEMKSDITNGQFFMKETEDFIE